MRVGPQCHAPAHSTLTCGEPELDAEDAHAVVHGLGGHAEAFGWGVTLVRLHCVALTLLHGGVLLSLVLMLVMLKVGTRSLGQRSIASAQQATYTLGAQDRTRTLGSVLLGGGALLSATLLHISGPVVDLAILGASLLSSSIGPSS